MSIVNFIIWLIGGLCTIFSGEINMSDYVLCWAALIIGLIGNIVFERRG